MDIFRFSLFSQLDVRNFWTVFGVQVCSCSVDCKVEGMILRFYDVLDFEVLGLGCLGKVILQFY